MTLTPFQWTMAFAAALAVHALAAVTLPQVLSRRNSDPPPPEPILVSLATPPAASPTPAAPPAPTPPVARQLEPEAAAPIPEVVDPPAPQPSVAAVNPTPVVMPQTPSREATTAANDHIPTPLNTTTTEELPADATMVVAPTPVLDTVDLDQLQSQYSKAAAELVNKHKHYPRSLQQRGVEGKVQVAVVVDRNGEILSPPIVINSSNIRLDKEAKASIRRAAPFPPFPDEIAKIRETWKMIITISFNLP